MDYVFLFFKQKTAYEMRISDWSSDVCSSDLAPDEARRDQSEHHEPQRLVQVDRALHEAGHEGQHEQQGDQREGHPMQCDTHGIIYITAEHAGACPHLFPPSIPRPGFPMAFRLPRRSDLPMSVDYDPALRSENTTS